jgi:glycerol kinase
MAYQSMDIIDAMQADSGITLHELRVDGGASRNALAMQFQADILGVPVVRPNVIETTALGAAYLAGLHSGFWSSASDVAKHWREDARYTPQMEAQQRSALLSEWHRAVERSRGWARQ